MSEHAVKRYSCKGANHAGLTVSNLDRQIEFFRDCLGFTERDRALRDPETASRITGLPAAAVDVTYMDGPGITIELIQYLEPKVRGIADSRPCDTGNTHIALNVSGIEELVAAAKGYGFNPMGELVTVRQGPNISRRAVYLRNDDRIIIELIEA